MPVDEIEDETRLKTDARVNEIKNEWKQVMMVLYKSKILDENNRSTFSVMPKVDFWKQKPKNKGKDLDPERLEDQILGNMMTDFNLILNGKLGIIDEIMMNLVQINLARDKIKFIKAIGGQLTAFFENIPEEQNDNLELQIQLLAELVDINSD